MRHSLYLSSGVNSEESVDELAHAAEGSSQSEDPGRQVCFQPLFHSIQFMFLKIINIYPELKNYIVCD